jgi:hypothetical protein
MSVGATTRTNEAQFPTTARAGGALIDKIIAEYNRIEDGDTYTIDPETLPGRKSKAAYNAQDKSASQGTEAAAFPFGHSTVYLVIGYHDGFDSYTAYSENDKFMGTRITKD